ncbi:nucleoside-diphosphate-sugar epimerase [Marmoricola sp. URHA0025 HA25]
MPEQLAVALVGSSGFVGSAVREALKSADVDVREVRAPRLTVRPGGLAQVNQALSRQPAVVEDLARSLHGVDVVVNAAGISDASAHFEEAMFGANAVLPRMIREAAVAADVDRFVQVSSSAVQGRRPLLDETADVRPFSPYSRAKALGEKVLEGCPETVLFRPTSVHGAGRHVTRTIGRLARSPWASVAGDGSAATPQVLVQNVASAVAFLCKYDGALPQVVLQPSEGMTTMSVLTILGGKVPARIPSPVARASLALGRAASLPSARMRADVRRLEMLWFGQAQVSGWLLDQGWRPPLGLDGWRELATIINGS